MHTCVSSERVINIDNDKICFVYTRRPSDNTDQRDTEALILDTIKSAVRFQKNVGDAWIKVCILSIEALKVCIL